MTTTLNPETKATLDKVVSDHTVAMDEIISLMQKTSYRIGYMEAVQEFVEVGVDPMVVRCVMNNCNAKSDTAFPTKG